MRLLLCPVAFAAMMFPLACGPAYAAETISRITRPAERSELSSPGTVIRWKNLRPAQNHRLLVGTQPKRADLFRSRLLPGDAKQAMARNIPRDGSEVWITLRTRDPQGRWHSDTRPYRAPLWRKLIETETITDLPASLMRLLSENLGLSRFAPLIQYDVRFVRIRYETTYKGRRITASGLLSYPLNAPSGYPLAVAQNGMIFGDLEAPSAFSLSFLNPQDSRFVGYEFLATAGYLVIFPDWIGFGDSSDVLFPMYNYQYSADASIDMMKATFEWIRSKRIPAGNKLFLAGYSMGGYTTNCLLHALETQQPFGPGKSVTAAALGAGGYDLVSVLQSSLDGRSIARPEQIAMLLASYNKTQSWNRPWTDFFQEPYASTLPDLLDGSYVTEQIHALMPARPASLLNPDFVERVRDGRERRFLRALAANSMHDWSPTRPVRLYHSRNDERIPFSDSRKTLQNMIRGGSRQVELIELPGDDHYNSVFGFMELVIPWFESLR